MTRPVILPALSAGDVRQVANSAPVSVRRQLERARDGSQIQVAAPPSLVAAWKKSQVSHAVQKQPQVSTVGIKLTHKTTEIIGICDHEQTSRRSSARALQQAPPPAVYPKAVRHPASAWRNLAGKFLPGSFFDEATAQRLTLGPRLPHHRRHSMTADEALAGIILGCVALLSVAYMLVRFL